MKRSFVQLFESNYNRYTNGGFLVGDVVVFKPGALKHPDFADNDELSRMVRTLIDSGNNLRIVNIKNNFPSAQGGNNDNNIIRRNAIADVAQELAPGRLCCTVSVPLEVLTVTSGIRKAGGTPGIEDYNVPAQDNNLPEIRDKQIYKSRVQLKPKPPEKPNEDNEFSVGRQTLTSDSGKGKDAKGDRELLNKNVEIPSAPVDRDPARYTAQYLPKKTR